MNQEPSGLTRSAEFRDIPIIENHLFEVRAGIPMVYVVRESMCLADSIRSMCLKAVGEGDGLGAEEAYLIQRASEMIVGLMMSIEVASEAPQS